MIQPQAVREREGLLAPACPLCSDSNAVVVQVGIREDPQREVYGCLKCSHLYLRPPDYNLREYYASEYRKSHSHIVGKEQTPQEHFDLMRPLLGFQEKLFRERVPKGAKVLEVGCSSGFFLDAIKDSYSVYGSEFNPDDVAFVRDKLGIPCEEGDVDEVFPRQTFTCIAAFHVLEHQPDPVKWLKKIRERLVGGGWLYLEVPNVDDALVSLYDIPEFRQWYFREPHLHYFNMHTLSQLVAAFGFEARVSLRQDYSLFNHLQWMVTGKPQADVKVARGMPVLIPHDHPARLLVARFLARVDREYRGLLDTLKACNVLICEGRLRDI